MSALATNKHSSPYNTIGIHLDLTSWRVTSSDANLPILPKMALVDRKKERLASETEHLFCTRLKTGLFCRAYETSP